MFSYEYLVSVEKCHQSTKDLNKYWMCSFILHPFGKSENRIISQIKIYLSPSIYNGTL